jgi:translation initiation factor 6
VNPKFSDNQVAKIREVLGVEVFRASTGGYDTVGANNIMTNKGIVFNNKIEETEKHEIERLSKLKGEQSTANFGSVSLGICSIANSNGAVVGEATTGIEASRISSNLSS